MIAPQKAPGWNRQDSEADIPRCVEITKEAAEITEDRGFSRYYL